MDIITGRAPPPALSRVTAPKYASDGLPYWEASVPQEVWGAYKDFRKFVFLVWQHPGLPEPTLAQYEIAFRLQFGGDTAESDMMTDEERTAFNRLQCVGKAGARIHNGHLRNLSIPVGERPFGLFQSAAKA